MKKVVVIGGGAAGCFAAIEIRRRHPDYEVTLLEAGPKLLAKVAITGGGRCNLTNTFASVTSLERIYPRGHQLMKRALRAFSQEDTMRWFEAEGVALVAQPDGCVFPRSQDAMQIVRTLERLLRTCNVTVQCNAKVQSVIPSAAKESMNPASAPEGCQFNGTPSLRSSGPSQNLLRPASQNSYLPGPSPCPCPGVDTSAEPTPSIRCGGGFSVATENTSYDADVVLVTTGGSPKAAGLGFLARLELEMLSPVPSLFTLRVADAGLKALQGTLAEVQLSLAGTPFHADGTLLLTDWGISGPATLRLSSYAARYLAGQAYKGRLLINWLPGERDIPLLLKDLLSQNPKRLLSSVHPEGLTARLWAHLLAKAGLREDLRCAELGSKGAARLAALLRSDEYALDGRVHFREEFVTCGGVSLSEISLSTMEARRYPGLFFAGEVLDVDAITGGFNLQAAWSMASVAARSI